jgi:hypothetical protein
MPVDVATVGAIAWTVVGVLLAAGGVLLAAKRAWRPLLAFIRNAERLVELIDAAPPILALAEAQLRPNGGGSLVDRVAMVPGLAARVEEMADCLMHGCPLFAPGHRCPLGVHRAVRLELREGGEQRGEKLA